MEARNRDTDPNPTPNPGNNGGGSHGGHGGGSSSGSKSLRPQPRQDKQHSRRNRLRQLYQNLSRLYRQKDSKTGDTDRMDVPMALLAIGMMAAAYVLMTGRKKTEE